jgi:hypothetical protein
MHLRKLQYSRDLAHAVIIRATHVFPGLSMSIRSPLVRFSGHTVQTIFRPEAPRRAAAGSETGLLFDFDDVPPNCFHVLADGAVVGRIMRVIQYRRRQVGVRSADAAARPAISGNGLFNGLARRISSASFFVLACWV